MDDVVTARSGGFWAPILQQRCPEPFQIFYGRIETSHVLVNKRSRFDLARWFVRNEIFSKGRQGLQEFTSAPQKAHVRREDFIAGAHQIIAIERLNIDEPVWTVVNAIEENLGSGPMRSPCRLRHVHNGTQRIGGNRA